MEARTVPLRRAAWALGGTAATAAVVTAGTLGVERAAGRVMGDLSVYRAGARAVLAALPLYSVTAHGAGFTYPPFAAMLLLPLAALARVPDQVLWTVVSALALCVLWRRCLAEVRAPRDATGPTGPEAGPRREAVLAAVVVASTALAPVWEVLRLGQVDLVLVLAVVLDLLRDDDARGRGALTGVAAGIKLTPLVFLPFLALTRQWRALAWAGGAFAATIAAAGLVLPGDSRAYWFHDVLSDRRVGPPVNVDDQSWHGFVSRVGPGLGLDRTASELAWLVPAALMALAGLAVGAAWWRRGERLAAVSAVGLGGLLASPISWVHHWVWCVPAGVALAALVRRRWGGLAATSATLAWFVPFALIPWWWLPRRGVAHTWGVGDLLLGDLVLWWALAVVVLLGALAATWSRSSPLRVATTGTSHAPGRSGAARPRRSPPAPPPGTA